MKELMRECRPKIVILLELRISVEAVDRVCMRLGKKMWARYEAIGFSGGVWILWNEEEINISMLGARRPFIHLDVRLGDGRCWLLRALYANP